jgi:hypothetical protein
MPAKSRRKKKYSGQRRPIAAASSPGPSGATAAPQTAIPVVPGESAPRTRPVTTRSPGATPPVPTNMGREVRTIAILASAAVVVIVVLSLVLR